MKLDTLRGCQINKSLYNHDTRKSKSPQFKKQKIYGLTLSRTYFWSILKDLWKLTFVWKNHAMIKNVKNELCHQLIEKIQLETICIYFYAKHRLQQQRPFKLKCIKKDFFLEEPENAKEQKQSRRVMQSIKLCGLDVKGKKEEPYKKNDRMNRNISSKDLHRKQCEKIYIGYIG